MENGLLQVKDLTKHFPVRGTGLFSQAVVHAVDEVSFSVAKGETLGLVGESGSGKTTVGKCVLRLIEPTSGTIDFDGLDILALRGSEVKRLRSSMQMVFQDPADSLNPRFTCGRTLSDALRRQGVPKSQLRDRMVQLLERVGMEASDLDKYPHQFSGGQQQRIGVARAISFRPKMLILDEPTSSLDVSVRAQIIELLIDLQKELELSYILISHDLSIIRYLSDRVAVMYLGKLVEVAPTKALFDLPLHPYTKALLESVPVPDPDVRKAHDPLVGEIPSPVDPPPGCRFHTRCHRATDQCRREEPQLVDRGGGRFVACHPQGILS